MYPKFVLHGVGNEEPIGDFWSAWTLEPIPVLGITLGLGLYLFGWLRLRRRSVNAIAPWRVVAFITGMLLMTLALISPIAAYSDRLFAIHMFQHLLILLVVPPLLLLGAPLIPTLWSLPRSWRRSVGRHLRSSSPLDKIGSALTNPMVASGAYVGTIAIWHLPLLFDMAQGRTWPHDLQHAMFFGTALLYWWPIIHPSGARRRLSFGRALPYLLPPFVEGMLIGALLTFSSAPIYQQYQGLEPTWGLSVLTDQQLAGLLMWVPGGMLLLIPLFALLVLSLQDEERRATQQSASQSRARPSPSPE